MGDAPSIRRFTGHCATAVVLATLVAMAACGSSGNTLTSPTTLAKCAVTTEAPASTFPSGGGTGTITVTTERECQWTATSDGNWLSITAGSSGQGPGTVQLSAAANADPTTRTAAVVVNNQRVQVSQQAAECRFDLGSHSASFSQAGGAGTVDVHASSALCTWTASSGADWIAITSGASGKGNAAVGFSVSPTTGAPRSGTLTIAGVAFAVMQAEGCTFSITPAAYTAGASGASTSVAVTAGNGCPWTAASNANWISLASAGGTGNGTVAVTIAATAGPTRTGTATIAGQTFAVTQSPGCGFDVSPLTFAIDASGGSGTATVTTADGCSWTAASNAPWITITAGASGSGRGTVTFNAAATAGPSRTGTLTVAGQTVSVAQSQGCTFVVSPQTVSVPSSGGTASVTVTAGAGCPWTASAQASWISISSGASGSGNGTVTLSAASTTGPARTGSVTVAGRTITVNQGQGCTYSLSPAYAAATAAGGAARFDVRTADGCGWSATSNASWLTLGGATSGSGNGSVQYAVSANTGPSRNGTISAAGETFTVTQDAGCAFAIAPSAQAVGSSGATLSVTVTAPPGCAWTAASHASWIGISSGAGGTGDGAVQLVVAANTDPDRAGTVTIAGQTFTVTQAGGCTMAVAPDTVAASAGGGPQAVQVTTAANCSWTAASNAPWIAISGPASGSGNGQVQLAIAANTGPARSGTATIATRTVTVNQDSGCVITITPTSLDVSSAGGQGSVTVTTADGCAWTAVSGTPWLTVTGSASGTGAGTVSFAVEPNATGAPRSGTLTIGGQVFTVNQAS